MAVSCRRHRAGGTGLTECPRTGTPKERCACPGCYFARYCRTGSGEPGELPSRQELADIRRAERETADGTYCVAGRDRWGYLICIEHPDNVAMIHPDDTGPVWLKRQHRLCCPESGAVIATAAQLDAAARNTTIGRGPQPR